MKRSPLRRSIGAAFSLFVIWGSAAAQTRSTSYGRVGLSFAPSYRQPGSYEAKVGAAQVRIGRNGAELRISRKDGYAHKLTMQLEGASPATQAVPEVLSPTKVNYLIGKDRSKWKTGVSSYQKVRVNDVRPNVDMLYYGNGSKLEYDLIARPGAAVRDLVMWFAGVSKLGGLQLHSDGSITAGSGASRLKWHKPIAYQKIDGRRIPVASSYRLLGKDRLGFSVGKYDRSKPLVIDPMLDYSTYLGGTNAEIPHSIAVDSSGSAIVVGETRSWDDPATGGINEGFPGTTPGTYNGGTTDAFVAKISPAGNVLMWATYIGGNDDDAANGVAVNPAGQIFIVGSTSSKNFPVTASAYKGSFTYGYTNPFLVQLTPDGSSMLYSTYFGCEGGPSMRNYGYGIALDSSGFTYICGSADAPNSIGFPLKHHYVRYVYAADEVFIAKFDTSRIGEDSLVYSSLLGGLNSDVATAIAVDSHGRAAVTGYTRSSDYDLNYYPIQFAQRGGGYFGDAFVSVLGAGGDTLAYSTYLGGHGEDIGTGIAFSPDDKIYVTGWTRSTDFWVTPGAVQTTHAGGDHDTFLVKINPDNHPGSPSLMWGTYIGGNGQDDAFGITVDSAGNPIVVGWTNSTNLPLHCPTQSTLAGYYNAFVTKVRSDGAALLYSSYLGGNNYDFAYAVAADSSGGIYVTGQTSSYDIIGTGAYEGFPLQNPIQSTLRGASDAFVTKVSITGEADVAVSLAGSPTPVNCGNPVTFTAVVTNNGPDPVRTVRLQINISRSPDPDRPFEIEWQSSTPGSGSSLGHFVSGGIITESFLLHDLAAGASTTVTVVVRTIGTGLGIVYGLADATATSACDEDLTNNRRTAEVTVNPPGPPPTVGISGTVFDDNNRSGIADAGETGVSGVVVFLDSNNNGIRNAGEPFATTARDGTFAFTSLTPGSYRLRVTNPRYWINTTTIPLIVNASTSSVSGIGVGIARPIRIISLSNSRVPIGSAPFTVTITGEGFTPASIAQFGGSPRVTRYMSPSQLAMDLTAIDLSRLAAVAVTVRDGSITSLPVTFTVFGTPVLEMRITSATRVAGAASDIRVRIELRNTGTAAFTTLQVLASTLNGVGSNSALPVAVGTLNAGATRTVTLTFPGTAGPRGATVPFTMSGDSAAGAYSLTGSVVIP